MTLTKNNRNKLRCTQRAMERQMLGISLRNEDIRSRTEITDVTERITSNAPNTLLDKTEIDGHQSF